MKQIFILILTLTSINAFGQRDTTTADLRTYVTMDTLSISSTQLKITTEWYAPANGYNTEKDTIIGTEKGVTIDSLIAVYQSDSVYYRNTLNGFFDAFVKYNVLYLNTKNRLAKYWAIKP